MRYGGCGVGGKRGHPSNGIWVKAMPWENAPDLGGMTIPVHWPHDSSCG